MLHFVVKTETRNESAIKSLFIPLSNVFDVL